MENNNFDGGKDMSREVELIEKMGVEFEERDGLFYPLVDGNALRVCVKTKNIGKYGHLWIDFMQEAYPERYRSLVRFGLLEEKAVAVNEEAYEMVCCMEEKLLKDSEAEKTFAEKYAVRMQVRMLVEEFVMREVVNVFH